MTTIKICVGTSCHLKGSYNVAIRLQQLIEKNELHALVDVQLAFCMGHCREGVCVALNGRVYSVAPEGAEAFFLESVLPAARAEPGAQGR